jgi:hypothetical protein
MDERKDSEYWIKFYEPVYPNIRFRAMERFRGGIRNLCNSKTGHARWPIRDDGEVAAILVVLESMAIEANKIIELSADEARIAQRLGLIPEGARAFLVKQPWPRNKRNKKEST